MVARRGPLAIVQTRQGWVVAAAGHRRLQRRPGRARAAPRGRRRLGPRAARPAAASCSDVDVAVVVSDTFGRTWREGLTDVAVGAAGIPALIDHRGAVDAFGNRLETTRTALVDELASAADLVKGKLAARAGRGRPRPRRRPAGARHRHPPARAAARRRPLPLRRPRPGRLPGARRATWSRGPASSTAVAEPFRIASAALPEFPVVLRYGGEGDGVVDVHLTDAVTITTALNLGALLGAAIVQLHAEGWSTRWEPVGTPGGSSLVGRLWLGTPPG